MSPDSESAVTSSPPIEPSEALAAGATVLTEDLVNVLRSRLPSTANHAIDAIREEVPAYADAFDSRLSRSVEGAVQMALSGFLRLASRGDASPRSPAIEGAYALGQAEARGGRSADALLAAYRVGARVSWRELSTAAVDQGISADSLASFAELVFAYIDELSAASVAGHADELETTGRARQRHLERLAAAILRGDDPDALKAAAEQADWAPATSLTAVILPEPQVRRFLSGHDVTALQPGEELPELGGLTVLLVADVESRTQRRRMLRSLAGRAAVVGPPRPWREARSSYRRAVRAMPLLSGSDVLDTEEHLATLVLNADPEARADLQARVLAPLESLRPGSAEKLRETLRAWLLHQGRRDEVAAALFVHPQTVRYRMGQLRELYGDRLEDPETIRELILALG